MIFSNVENSIKNRAIKFISILKKFCFCFFVQFKIGIWPVITTSQVKKNVQILDVIRCT